MHTHRLGASRAMHKADTPIMSKGNLAAETEFLRRVGRTTVQGGKKFTVANQHRDCSIQQPASQRTSTQ